MKRNVILSIVIGLCGPVWAQQTHEPSSPGRLGDISPANLSNIVINYTFAVQGKPFRDRLTLNNTNDLFTFAAILRKTQPVQGICGCRWYSILLQYMNGTTVAIPWPHGTHFERDGERNVHYEVSDRDLRTLWTILLKHGIDSRALPAEVKDTPPGKHVVARGESLTRIALAHGVTARDLQTLNNIKDPDKIVVGQELLLPDQRNDAQPNKVPEDKARKLADPQH